MGKKVQLSVPYKILMIPISVQTSIVRTAQVPFICD